MKDQGPEETNNRNTDFVWPLVIQSQIYPHRLLNAKIPRNALEGLFLEATQQGFSQQMKSTVHSPS